MTAADGTQPTWERVDGGPPSLCLARSGAALRIEFNRPHRLNAFDVSAGRELLAVLQDAATDDGVRSVLVTGAGRAFSAGADISGDVSHGVGARLREITNPTILALREMPKPVIAAVNGPAAGLGAAIAFASDLVLAADSAYFLMAFARVGLGPDAGTGALLAARTGSGRALQLMLLGERLPAEEALQWGLADRVVPTTELQHVAEQLAVDLARGPTAAFAATKRSVNAATMPHLHHVVDLETRGQETLAAGHDFSEGTAAFAQKRDPFFLGR